MNRAGTIGENLIGMKTIKVSMEVAGNDEGAKYRLVCLIKVCLKNGHEHDLGRRTQVRS